MEAVEALTTGRRKAAERRKYEASFEHGMSWFRNVHQLALSSARIRLFSVDVPVTILLGR
ncbi:hypothetical protein RvY_04270 [Ramazzottius varieornatus]|uniref:Uncharacterized protein n=1 Tax=Ramazzottius varieornatus TaxID=947166 RepID=A0A1D1V0C2_RAMVA|nr:hypothetical protein RvY_04270 [Ramazzottius varieornatus]